MEDHQTYWVMAKNGDALGFVEYYGKYWDARCPEGWVIGSAKLRKEAVEKVVSAYIWSDSKQEWVTRSVHRWNQVVESIKSLNEGNLQKRAPIYTDEMTEDELSQLVNDRLGHYRALNPRTARVAIGLACVRIADLSDISPE